MIVRLPYTAVPLGWPSSSVNCETIRPSSCQLPLRSSKTPPPESPVTAWASKVVDKRSNEVAMTKVLSALLNADAATMLFVPHRMREVEISE